MVVKILIDYLKLLIKLFCCKLSFFFNFKILDSPEESDKKMKALEEKVEKQANSFQLWLEEREKKNQQKYTMAGKRNVLQNIGEKVDSTITKIGDKFITSILDLFPPGKISEWSYSNYYYFNIFHNLIRNILKNLLFQTFKLVKEE